MEPQDPREAAGQHDEQQDARHEEDGHGVERRGRSRRDEHGGGAACRQPVHEPGVDESCQGKRQPRQRAMQERPGDGGAHGADPAPGAASTGRAVTIASRIALPSGPPVRNSKVPSRSWGTPKSRTVG